MLPTGTGKRPVRTTDNYLGRFYYNTSGDATASDQKYCIIFGQPMQAEHPFPRWLLFLYSFFEER